MYAQLIKHVSVDDRAGGGFHHGAREVRERRVM